MSPDGKANKLTSPRLLTICLWVLGAAFIGAAVTDNYWIGGGPGFGLVEQAILAGGIVCLVASFLPRGIATFVFASALTLVVTVAVSEVTLRAFFTPKLKSAYQLHPDYLYSFRPGSVRDFTHMPINGGESLEYRINDDGFRGANFEPNDNSKSVFVYGDSFIHAAYTPTAQTFVVQLEQALQNLGYSGHKIVNAGVAGYGPDQVLNRLKDELPRYKPAMVVVGVYAGNDFGDLVRNKLYRVGKADKPVPNNFTFDPLLTYIERLSQQELYVRKLIAQSFGSQPSINSNPDQYAKVDRVLKQQLDEYEAYVLNDDNVVSDLRTDPYSADISLQPDSASARYKIKLMSQIIGEIAQVAREENIPLLLVHIPHPIDVMLGDHESGRVDLAKYPNYSPERLIDSLNQICKLHELNCVDLMPTMRLGGNEFFLLGGDDHWNASGQLAAANFVAHKIQETGQLK